MPISDYLRNLRTKIGNDMIVIPATAAVVVNDDGEVLLLRRSDNGQWATPAGTMEPGEEPAETVVRETFEETGVEVVPERILAVYGGADNLVTYPNGDQVAATCIVFLCRPVGGTPQVNDDESLEVRYFSPDDLPDMHSRYRTRIEQALKGVPEAHFR